MDTPPSTIWHNYRETKPEAEGWYKWRLRHNSYKDVTLVFLAEFRVRGAGYKDVISPEFDYWDGYRVLLPDGPIEWSEYEGDPPTSVKLLEVGNAVNAPCPFCGQIPEWGYNGRFIGACPNEAESFYLKCCSWFNGSRNPMGNPLDLTRKRNEAIAKHGSGA